MSGRPGPAAWPDPADFAPPPSKAQRTVWRDADRADRPARLARLRDRFAGAGVDAYFGIRPEHTRYLTGMVMGDGEEKVSGQSGWFVVGQDELVLLADSRYRVQATAEAPDARITEAYHDLPSRWSALMASVGARRVAVEAALVPQSVWTRLAEADPSVELIPVEGWVEADRAIKTPAELERVAAACAVADRALATLLPTIQPGVTEADLALRLEWLIRTGGAEALAFDVACLSGAQAALPHGSPRDVRIQDGAVLLFDFGAQVDGYRSDMTRTLAVGEPSDRDTAIHDLVARAQAAAIEAIEEAVASGRAPVGRAIDGVARGVIEAAGHGDHFGHGLGHGIGLATHEAPSLSRTAPEDAVLPSPTVFSVEPGVYLHGETGVRIEDLIHLDAAAGIVERLTTFPRELLVVGA